MNSNYFMEYIKEDMCHGADISVTDIADDGDPLQNLYSPRPPVLDVDVDVLLLLTRAEIQTIERPIKNQWNQLPWRSGGPETEEHFSESDYQEKLDDWLRVSTPSEASLDTNTDSDMDRLSLDSCGVVPAIADPIETAPLACQTQHTTSSHPKETLSAQSPPTEPRSAHSRRDLHKKVPPRKRSQSSSNGQNATPISRAATELVSNGVTNTSGSRSYKRSSPEDEFQPSRKKRRSIVSPSFSDAATAQTLPLALPALRRTSRRLPHGRMLSAAEPEPSRNDQVVVLRHSLEVPLSNLPSIASDPNRSDGLVHLNGSLLGNQSESALPGLPTETETDRTLCMTADSESRRGLTKSTTSDPPEVLSSSTARTGRPVSRNTIEGRLRPRKKQIRPECSSSKSTSSQVQEHRRGQSDLEDPDNQKLEARLREWGFVRRDKILYCPCNQTFSRRWDAGRHWLNASIHKAERQKLGDFSDSAKYRCVGCGEVLSRKDSLQRHMAKCGLRRKRRYRGGWDPNAARVA